MYVCLCVCVCVFCVQHSLATWGEGINFFIRGKPLRTAHYSTASCLFSFFGVFVGRYKAGLPLPILGSCVCECVCVRVFVCVLVYVCVCVCVCVCVSDLWRLFSFVRGAKFQNFPSSSDLCQNFFFSSFETPRSRMGLFQSRG